MPAYKIWVVTRTVIAHERDGTDNIIHTSHERFGGTQAQQVCETARARMPIIEAQYEARELTGAEYAAHHKGEPYGEPEKTTH